jgi:hypothetical protein
VPAPKWPIRVQLADTLTLRVLPGSVPAFHEEAFGWYRCAMMSKTPPAEADLATLLQQLRSEHAVYDAHIDELNRRVYLSIREQAEKKRLQKLKLQLKDRISWLESR